MKLLENGLSLVEVMVTLVVTSVLAIASSKAIQSLSKAERSYHSRQSLQQYAQRMERLLSQPKSLIEYLKNSGANICLSDVGCAQSTNYFHLNLRAKPLSPPISGSGFEVPFGGNTWPLRTDAQLTVPQPVRINMDGGRCFTRSNFCAFFVESIFKPICPQGGTCTRATHLDIRYRIVQDRFHLRQDVGKSFQVHFQGGQVVRVGLTRQPGCGDVTPSADTEIVGSWTLSGNTMEELESHNLNTPFVSGSGIVTENIRKYNVNKPHIIRQEKNTKEVVGIPNISNAGMGSPIRGVDAKGGRVCDVIPEAVCPSIGGVQSFVKGINVDGSPICRPFRYTLDFTEICFSDENGVCSECKRNNVGEIVCNPRNLPECVETIDADSDGDFDTTNNSDCRQQDLDNNGVIDNPIAANMLPGTLCVKKGLFQMSTDIINFASTGANLATNVDEVNFYIKSRADNLLRNQGPFFQGVVSSFNDIFASPTSSQTAPILGFGALRPAIDAMSDEVVIPLNTVLAIRYRKIFKCTPKVW